MRPLHLALFPALLLVACATQEDAHAPVEEPAPQAEAPSKREAARAALDAGDFEKVLQLASELLLESRLADSRAALDAGRLDAAWAPLGAALELSPRDARALALRRELADAVVPGKLEEARRLLLEGDPRDAMLPLDDAVLLAPDDPEVQLLRGECSLRMGVEDGNPLMFADARIAFLSAARTNRADEAWLGAARAGWLSYYATSEARELADALAHAKTGMGRLGTERPFEKYLDFDLERTYAEIAFTAYTAARGNGAISERSNALFEETRTALEAVIGDDASDSWAWGQLANLYEWEGRTQDANDALARGLALAPQDSSLHDSQVRVALQLGGWGAVAGAYEAFTSEHPKLAVGHWHLGRATYEQALAAMLQDQSDQSAGFQDAEAQFREARTLDESYRESCLGYEVICRDGLGWSLYYGGELDLAADAFRSMEELFPGGMRWEVQGKLWSGVASLEFLIGVHNDAWEARGPEYSERFPHLVKAAALADELFAYDEESSTFANNVGYFNRDVATNYEQQAVGLMLQRDAEPSVVAGLLSKAVEHMERSYAAYVRAAELAPTDARIINDTGLILTYYLQRDLDVAERYLHEAISVGLPQLEAGIEDEEQRTMTREAVGDAYQNLGVLELTLRGDAAAARPWFRKSLDYERMPRGQVTQHFLPLCDKLEAGETTVERVREAYYWKDLEPELVLNRIAALRELMELTATR